MPRNQNAHAQVNAGFLYKMDNDDIVVSARIVYGGLSGKFTHAYKTEKYLQEKNLYNDDTVQKALMILQEELIVDEITAEPSPKFRKKLALGLFYKVTFYFTYFKVFFNYFKTESNIYSCN